MTALPRRFIARWEEHGGRDGPGVYATLSALYQGAERAYHDLSHIEECLAWLDAAEGELQRAGEAEIALWFHDAVQDGGRDDVGESAALFCRLAADGFATSARERIVGLIEATRHDDAPLSGDAAVLADIDLSILGSSPARFARYEADVRREHADVPEAAFRRARARILRGLLARLRIYRSAWFGQRLEARARDNLAASLRGLESAAAEPD